MNDMVPTGARITPAAISGGAAHEPGDVVASRPGGLALHLPGELPWTPGEGVFLVWHTEGRDRVAVATFRRVVAEVALFELLSPFRQYNRRLYRRYETRLRAFVYESEDQEPAHAMVVDLSYSGMRIAMAAPPLASRVTVVLQAGAAGIGFSCRVLGSLISGGDVHVRTQFERLDDAQAGVLNAIITRLDELEQHGPDVLAG